jgi:glutamine cyclotransferase
VAKFPHDTTAFTQGLVYHKGWLYESTGLHGRSSLRRVLLDSGTAIDSRTYDFEVFAEGIAVNDSVIVQLTWRNGRAFVYSVDNFDTVSEFSYLREGWGLTWDGRRYLMSDGSTTLRCLDPITFRDVGELEIREPVEPYPSWRIVPLLNELEYVKGDIYANIWKSNRIAIINPANGRVKGWIDLSDLLTEDEQLSGVDVPNGIAYDADSDRLFVTGKLWPWIFEVRLREIPAPWEPF